MCVRVCVCVISCPQIFSTVSPLMITKRLCLQLYTISGCMDEQMLVHTDQLLEELGDQPATDDADHQDGDSISSSNEMELT